MLAVKPTDKDGFVHFAAGLARGEGGLAPAAIVAADKGDYAFLSLKSPAFDLTDRGVAGRQVPAGLDAFVYTERGVYRSGETVHVTALLRDVRGIAAASPLTLVVERPDGVEYRRALVADQGLGGHSWSVPIVPSASTGTWRVRAFTDPKRPPVGEASFLVEDYVADRIEFDLTSTAKVIPRNAPAQLSVDGHFLYGAPASQLDLQGAVTIAAAKERPGFAGYAFGLFDDDVTAVRQDLDDLPATDATGKASFPVKLDKIPVTSRPLEATITVSMAESGGRAVERKLTLPVAPAAPMIGVKPAFSGRSLGDGANADFDVVMAGPDGKMLAQSGLRYELLRVETSYQWYRQNGQWEYEPVKRTERVANGTVDVAAGQAGAHFAAGEMGPLSPGSVGGRAERRGHLAHLRRRLLCGSQCRHARPAGSRARQAGLQVRRCHERGGDRAHRRPPHAQYFHRPAGRDDVAGCESRQRARAA